MKKYLGFLLSFALICGLFPAKTAFANTDWPANVNISADGGIVMDANSGAVLYGKNMHETYFPASITKILTALIILENCDLDDTVTFSFTAINTLEPNSTIIGARVGDQMNVRDCLYALLLQSANEVANALAEHCSGSIEAFAELMNRKAESLGCLNSHFNNPSGLNDPNHYTSAYDMALISRAAFANPTFVEIDSTTYYDVQPGQLKQYPNGWRYYAHHRMLKKNDSVYYDGIIGGKTGYTSLAGNTLVTCAEREEMKLIAVVLNGHQTHYSDTKTLLNFGFENFRPIRIADKESTYKEIENDLTIAGIFPGTATRLSIDEDSSITLPTGGDFLEVTSSLNYELGSMAPDGAVARIDYMYGDNKVGQAYLKAITTQNYVPGADKALSVPEILNVTLEKDLGTNEPASSDEADMSVYDTSEAPQDQTSETPFSGQIFSVLKVVLIILAAVCIIGGAAFGIHLYLRKKKEDELILRKQRRERRLKEWGHTPGDFESIMENRHHSRRKPPKRRHGKR